MICLLYCTYDAMGLITANGVVDAGMYLPYLAPLENSLRAVVTSAVINCAKSTDDILRGIQNLEASCSVFPLMFQLCVMEYSLENCPAERFTSSLVCHLVKSGAPRC
uniref:Uncharacterized protein n=1 Tax=Anopheles atroparvus TaxID=41427 RepID=A0AAG5DAB2_ANOAO